MALTGSDKEAVEATARDAAAAKAASEGTSARIDALTRLVVALGVELAETRKELRDAIVMAVIDIDHPGGATYWVQGLGASKTHILDGEQWADFKNRFPWVIPEQWAGRTLAKIPTHGPDPDPPSTPAD